MQINLRREAHDYLLIFHITVIIDLDNIFLYIHSPCLSYEEITYRCKYISFYFYNTNIKKGIGVPLLSPPPPSLFPSPLPNNRENKSYNLCNILFYIFKKSFKAIFKICFSKNGTLHGSMIDFKPWDLNTSI